MDNSDRPVTGCGTFFLSELNKTQTNNGLTKREHFAGLAMQGFISAGHGGMPNASELADYAVRYADALLGELDK